MTVQKFLKKWDEAKELAKKEMLDDGRIYDLCEAISNFSDEEYIEILREFKKNLKKYHGDINTVERWRWIAKEEN